MILDEEDVNEDENSYITVDQAQLADVFKRLGMDEEEQKDQLEGIGNLFAERTRDLKTIFRCVCCVGSWGALGVVGRMLDPFHQEWRGSKC